jgi:tRNA-specific 2-thiouridylase
LKPEAAEAGDIVHIDGTVLGRHDGIINYTVGQRRGLGIPGPAPFYVVRLETQTRQVVVGSREDLLARRIQLRGLNWLGSAPLSADGVDVAVRIRSSAPPQPARLFAEDDKAWVVLQDGEYGIAAGQACVFYSDTAPRARVLGGGWIKQALSLGGGAPRAGVVAEAGTGQPA